VEILNIEGQIFKRLTTQDIHNTVDISNLPAGMYIIKFKTEEGIAVKKFIKQ